MSSRESTGVSLIFLHTAAWTRGVRRFTRREKQCRTDCAFSPQWDCDTASCDVFLQLSRTANLVLPGLGVFVTENVKFLQ